ncbi:MAG: type I-D CRISPR-associated protein Cas5/Csc1 [Anaerolineae bacterium]|nr:type I-D CRISPR-associated protein Cas5/Csc1 [Anaerolineae bacterium]
MLLYECQLTFHDVLFYETRTLGRLYETGRLLHNIALCYALGFATTTYHHADDVPRYAQEIEALNAAGIYLTPAAGLEVAYAVHTFKLGDERNAVRMEKSNINLPSYGRAKEVLVGSKFRFGALSPRPLKFPKWVRMGLWMGKAELKVNDPPVEVKTVQGRAVHTVARYPMNPTDLPDSAALKLFDLISMRPSSLIENAEIEAEAWWQTELPDGGRLMLPAGLRHRFTS